MKNPYSWNTVNSALFYGQERLDLLLDMIDGLTGSPRSSFGITGSRRMGKTTLLRRLEQDLRSGGEQWKAGGLLVIPIYIDGLTLPRPLTGGYVWFEILQRLFASLSVTVPQSSQELDFSTFKQYLQPVLSGLSERPRVIVLFDEIEPIMVYEWSGGFFAQWRALLSNSPGLHEFFTAVFAGAREMAELQRDVGSPLKDILVWRVLRALDSEDASLLMREPVEIDWPGEFLECSYDETGGHPMLLQYVMQKVCSGNQDSSQVVQLLRKVIRQFERERAWQFEEWWNRYCTPFARRVYARMPDDGTTIPLRDVVREFGLSNANVALEILQHVGIVSGDEDGMLFRYSGEMFRRWFRKSGTFEEAIEHDYELYTRLTKIESRYNLAEKYLSAWKIYQVDLPNYSGAVGEIRDTFSLILGILAPDEKVKAEPGFKVEAGQNRPTRKQKVKYIVRKHYAKETAMEIESDVDLLEVLLSDLAVTAYNEASAFTHTTATRERAFEILKRWDAILKRLLPE